MHDTNAIRRAFLRGSASAVAVLPVAAAPALAAADAAIPVPALVGAPPLPHPDHELLEAERTFLAALDAKREADRLSEEAHAALNARIGPTPAELVPTWADRERADRITAFHEGRGRTAWFGWANGIRGEDGELMMVHRWTAKLLRSSVAGASAALGRAGMTPHVTRRWRALLPVAEAYEAKWAAAEAVFRTRELTDAYMAAHQRCLAAEQRAIDLPARAAAGVGVKARVWMARRNGQWGTFCDHHKLAA